MERELDTYDVQLSLEEMIFLRECIAVAWKAGAIRDPKVSRKVDALDEKLKVMADAMTETK